ncbi:MAG: substrate-binding domain-containing protein [Mizugakiibacter sp.]|uniref:substrate-binding domain-containing protein n=1 Tax=Mizugakiibacter sp. TaxID=1972610 RepID=UPI0031C67B95|nr:substrate-binding domain-containing protein [Xanthomonadaceae bacterium]
MARTLLTLLLAGLVAVSGAAVAGKHGASKSNRAGVAKSANADRTALTWRGDVASSRGVGTDIARAWQASGHGPIQVVSFNTISGIDAVAGGQADMAGSARPAYAKRAEESGLTFTPVAWDGLVMIAHARNPVAGISLKQLHDVYFGKITNWKQLGGNDAPINLYSVASPLDGIEYSLRELLFKRGDQPVAAPRLYMNTAKLEEAVTLDPNGFGVTTLSGARENDKLRMLPVEGVRPTPSAVADGSYPLYTPLYVVSRDGGPHAATVRAFLDFLQGDRAKAILREHGLLPYADGLALANQRDDHLAWVDARVRGVTPMNGPLAAPRATYSAQSSIAPTSERTTEARQRAEKSRRKSGDKDDGN